MKLNLLIVSLAFLGLVGTSSFAASNYSYDLQKFQAILASKDVAAKFGFTSLEGINLVRIDTAARKLHYRLVGSNNRCTADLEMAFDAGFTPNYRVTSVSNLACRR